MEDSDYWMNIIQERAEQVVPEWKWDREHPDMGMLLARIFADMMADSAKRFHQAVRTYPLHLYNMLGLEALPSGEAGGYVSFQTVNDEVPGVAVMKGNRVSGMNEEGSVIFYETAEDIFVSSARYQKACLVDGREDSISQFLSFPIGAEQWEDRQSHELYIGHSYLFGWLTEGEIMIDLHGSFNGREEIPSIETMDRMRWFYHSAEGFVPFLRQSYRDGRLHLSKKKDMPAFASFQLGETECFCLKAEMEKMQQGEEVVFPGLSLAAAGNYIPPDCIYDGNMELDWEDFLPFGESPYLWQELYLCSREVFSKKGAEITLSFELEMVEYPGEIKAVEVPIHWKNIMRESDFPKAESIDVLIPAISIEYYNGMGFTRIPGMEKYGGIFGSHAKDGRHALVFRCPEDISPCMVSVMESCCIRWRICRLSAPYAVDGVYRVPRIRDCLLSYQYGENTILAEQIFCRNQLKEERIACLGRSIPFYQAFPDAQMLYLAFSRALDEEEISILIRIRERKQEKIFPCHYEYYGQKGWQELKVYDDTQSLSRTGILSLTAEHSFQKQSFFGWEGYWIRILWETAGEQYLLPQCALPPIEGISMNSVAVNAVSGSGSQGNLPAGAVNTMEKSIGFISKLENTEAMSGGYDAERTEQALKRNAAVLRYRGRAVTSGDFEDLVMGMVRNIRQVRCFSGRDAFGKRHPGHITLVVLPQEGETHFEQVRRNILDCLLPNMDDQLYQEGRLHIIEPSWVSIQVYMTVMAKASAKSYLLREKIRERIREFVHPVNGNFDHAGWKIGTLPTAVQIANACSQMEEILYIRHISLDQEAEEGLYVLGRSGRHRIEIITEEEEGECS